MPQDPLIAEFDRAVYWLYQRIQSEADHHATRLHEMFCEHRGLGTARILLHASKPSEDFNALCERGRLDLTVEALVYDNPQWHRLFTQPELAICEMRLREYRGRK